MIYVVAGLPRSGTSMMMRALKAGGLVPAYSKLRDALADERADDYYHMNPGGLYELTKNEMRVRGFPRMYDGKLIKLLGEAHRYCIVHAYRVVYMLRDVREIQASMEASMNISPSLHVLRYQQQENLAAWRNRRDAAVTTLEYDAVLDDPGQAFRALGWPVTLAAADVVDPGQKRHAV